MFYSKFNPLIAFNLIVGIFSLGYSLVSWAIGFSPGVYIMVTNALLLLVIVQVSQRASEREGVQAKATHAFLFINCFVAILGCTWFSGGLLSPVIPWFCMVPIAAALLLGFNKNAVVWLLIAIACVSFFGVLALSGITAPVLYDTRFTPIFWVVSLSGNAVLLFLLTQVFEDVKNKALAEADASNRDLKKSAKRLGEVQAQLVQTEKLASLGALVAGIAHELNTPIGNALTTATSLQDACHDIKSDIQSKGISKSQFLNHLEQSTAMSDLIARSCERASVLISSFKRVAVDQHSEQRQLFELSDLIKDHVNALLPNFNRVGASLAFEVQGAIHCDSYPGPLGQVIGHVVQNALLHGFADGRKGEVSLSAVCSAQWVDLEISDNGVGMDALVLARIFDPFFTTRLGQGGSGLGLSVSQNIMVGVMGGGIQVVSEKGVGTRFYLRFPVHAPAKVPGKLALTF